jgi:DinB family protein
VSPAPGFLERLDAVIARLEAHAARPARGVTAPDPRTGERWDQGQIWAHLAEFIPYWIVETGVVLAADEPPAFGRTQSDPGRIGEIARRRDEPPATLMAAVREEEAALRDLIAGLDGTAWERRGIHPTLGSMTVTEIVEDFLVGHLEQHADQLDSLDSV